MLTGTLSTVFGVHVRAVSEPCQGRVRGMSGPCQAHILGACQGRVRAVSGPCQGHVRAVSGHIGHYCLNMQQRSHTKTYQWRCRVVCVCAFMGVSICGIVFGFPVGLQ